MFSFKNALDLISEYYQKIDDISPEQKEYNIMMGFPKNWQGNSGDFWARYKGTYESAEDFAQEYIQVACGDIFNQLPVIVADCIDYSKIVEHLEAYGWFIFRYTGFGVVVFSGGFN